MKRSRPANDRLFPTSVSSLKGVNSKKHGRRPLGCIEFAAVLNAADDPVMMIRCLRQFASTIRRDARVALLPSFETMRLSFKKQQSAVLSDHPDTSDDEDESSGSGDELDTNVESKDDDYFFPSSKRVRFSISKNDETEIWKADTANYNVPFIGTSIVKGDTGHVVVGEWPTGLVQAYLKSSPLAVELIISPVISSSSMTDADILGRQWRDDTALSLISKSSSLYKTLQKTKKGRKLFLDLQKAHFRALSALLMAVVPKRTLQIILMSKHKIAPPVSNRDAIESSGTGDSNESLFRFLPELVKRILPSLFVLLKTELKLAGASTSAGASSSRSTKYGSPHGSRGSTISVGPLAASILHIMTILSATSVTMARHIARSLEISLPDGLWRAMIKAPLNNKVGTGSARAVEDDTQDASEVLQTSPDDVPQRQKWHFEARLEALKLVCVLLGHFDTVVFACISYPGHKERKISTGMLYAILQVGLVVYDCENVNSLVSSLHFETAKILISLRQFLLGSDLFRSLKRAWTNLLSKDAMTSLTKLASQAPAFAAYGADGCVGSVSFQQILNGDDTYSADLMRRDGFGLMLANEARRLLFLLLGNSKRSPLLQVDDWQNKFTQQGQKEQVQNPSVLLRSLSLLMDLVKGVEIQNFVIYCLNETPRLFPFVLNTLIVPDSKRVFPFIQRVRFIERIMSDGPCINRCYRYTQLTDSQRFKNLVFPGTFKKNQVTKALYSRNPLVVTEMLKLLVHAVKRCYTFTKVQGSNSVEGNEAVSTLLTCLPDMQTILSIASQHDILKHKTGAIIMGHLITFVSDLRKIAFSFVDDFNFNWLEILPCDAKVFCKATCFLQKKILSFITYSIGHLGQQRNVSLLSSQFLVLLNIVLTTSLQAVFAMARKLAVEVLASSIVLDVTYKEWNFDIRYECSCWVDGLTDSICNEFCTCLREVSPIHCNLALSRAWKSFNLPIASLSMNISSLAVHVFGVWAKASEALKFFTCQVAAKCIVHHCNPLSTATIMNHKVEPFYTENTAGPVHAVIKYSSSIINFNEHEAIRLAKIETMMNECFRQGFFSNSLQQTSRFPNGIDFMNENIFMIIRQSLHYFFCSSTQATKSLVFSLIRFAVPIIAKVSISEKCYYDMWSHIKPFFGSSLIDINPANLFVVAFLLVSSGNTTLTKDELFFFINNNRTRKSISSISYIEKGKFNWNAHILFVYTMCDFFSKDVCIGVLTALMLLLHQKPLTALKALHETCTKLLKRFLTFDIDGTCGIEEFTQCASKTWLLSISSNCSLRQSSNLLFYLEQALCLVISHEKFSAILQSDLLCYSSKEILFHCFFTKDLTKVFYRGEYEHCYVASLLDFDFLLYAPVFLNLLSMSSPPQEMTQLIRDGLLDEALVLTFCQNDIRKSPEVCTFVARIMAERISLINLFGDETDTSFLDRRFNALKNVFILLSQDALLDKLSFDVYDRIVHVMNDVLIRNSDCTNLCDNAPLQNAFDFAFELCMHRNQNSSKNLLLFSMKLLTTLVFQLTNISQFIDNIDSYSHFITALIEKIERMVLQEVFIQFNFSVTSISTMCKICIHNGLDDTVKNVSMRRLFLGLVHSFADKLARMTTGDKQNNERYHVVLSIIFRTITTHECFDNTLRCRKGDSNHAKQITLKTILACLSGPVILDFDEVRFVRQLGLGFSAGLTKSDLLIRTIVCKCSKMRKKSMSMLMGHLRWGESEEVRGAVFDDWFIEVINLDRVLATIADFPIEDKIVIEEYSEPSERERNDHLNNSIADQWIRQLSDFDDKGLIDCRYSPGTILPFILKALASETDFSSETSKADETSEPKRCLERVQLCKRLCESGCIAITIATLCADCSLLRRMSVAILGQFYQLANSIEARQLTSWRDRPQLVMLLKSLRRGMTARKTHIGGNSSGTIKISGFSATFLAHAFIILSRPGHAMFPAINHYFLKSEMEHGAYQDFTRIPGFMSHFCSHAITPYQAKEEREGAINLLFEGFTAQDCYRYVASCHAVELLLSSVDGLFRMSPSPGTELRLTFDALARMINRGGYECATHVIGRHGLLQWIQSFLVGRSSRNVCCNMRCRKSLIKLVGTTIVSASTVLSTEEIQESIIFLALPILNLSCCDLAVIIGELIHIFALILGWNDHEEDLLVSPIKTHGITLSSAQQLLIDTHCTIQRKKFLTALCVLPCQHHPTLEKSSISFCLLALNIVVENRSYSTDDFTRILQRVALLLMSSHLKEQELVTISDQLLYLRKRSARNEMTKRAWLACQRSVLKQQMDNKAYTNV